MEDLGEGCRASVASQGGLFQYLHVFSILEALWMPFSRGFYGGFLTLAWSLTQLPAPFPSPEKEGWGWRHQPSDSPGPPTKSCLIRTKDFPLMQKIPKDLRVLMSDTPMTQEITRISWTLCQDPGSKIKILAGMEGTEQYIDFLLFHNYINWFSHVTRALHSWEKNHLVMVYNPFIHCWIQFADVLFRNLGVYVHEYRSVVFFSWDIFAWFWYESNTGPTGKGVPLPLFPEGAYEGLEYFFVKYLIGFTNEAICVWAFFGGNICNY